MGWKQRTLTDEGVDGGEATGSSACSSFTLITNLNTLPKIQQDFPVVKTGKAQALLRRKYV